MSSNSVQTVVVKDDAGRRLDNFLLSHLKGIPRSRIYRMIRSGEVRINGGRAKPSAHLNVGDKVRIPPVRDQRETTEIKVSDSLQDALRSAVLYEDEEVVVLNKPSGLSVHGGSGDAFGIAEILDQVFDRSGLALAHRIDKETSGCLIVTKSRPAMRRYHELFRANKIRKQYDLIVGGLWPEEIETISLPIERFLMANGERRVRINPEGQKSRTDFNINKKNALATWLRAKPQTGRTHQIRIHAQSVDHPVLGDDKYGDRSFKPKPERLMLHATSIELPTGDLVDAPIPNIFEKYWERISSKC